MRNPGASSGRDDAETNPRPGSGVANLWARRDHGPERKLLRLVEFDGNQAATILKQWIRQGANG
jgi:flagellar biosynthesis/type III secretory pathway M-ring protein FliF/YscJ